MTRHWKLLGYLAILTAALATAPEIIRAADPEKTKTPPPAAGKDLERIDKALQKMGSEIARDIEGLKLQVDQLRKDLDALRKTEPRVSNYGPAGKDIDELRKQLDLVQQTLNAIRGQLPTTSTSLRPAAGTSRIRLVNDYPFTNEFVVNGGRYILEPGMTRELSLSAGTFSYRVPTVGITDQDRVLGANEVYTIRVFPQ